jgi:hypothetical protein
MVNVLMRALDAAFGHPRGVAGRIGGALMVRSNAEQERWAIGVDATSTVHSSEDSGATWRPGHALGQRPQALLTAGGGQVFVPTEAAIHRSMDNGATFKVLHAFKSQ